MTPSTVSISTTGSPGFSSVNVRQSPYVLPIRHRASTLCPTDFAVRDHRGVDGLSVPREVVDGPVEPGRLRLRDVRAPARLHEDLAVVLVRARCDVVPLAQDALQLVPASVADVGRAREPGADVLDVVGAVRVAQRAEAALLPLRADAASADQPPRAVHAVDAAVLDPVGRALVRFDGPALYLPDDRPDRAFEALGCRVGRLPFPQPRLDGAALGDGRNDLTMIEAAGVGVGVAMANAYPDVLAAADYVSLSNDENGVAAALEHYGVI